MDSLEQEILKEVKDNKATLEAILKSTEKTRKYFMWTLIITVAAIILPLIGLLFAVPSFLSSYTAALGM